MFHFWKLISVYYFVFTKNDRNGSKSAISDKKKDKYTFGEKILLWKIKFFTNLKWNILFPERKPTTFFLRKSWKSDPTLGKKMVTFCLFSLRKGQYSKHDLNVSLLKILLCIGIFSAKNYQYGYISAIPENKKASILSEEKKVSSGKKEMSRSNTLTFLNRIFFSGRKPIPFFLRNWWKRGPTFVRKMVTFCLFMVLTKIDDVASKI